ncbi:hypothetical protein AB0L34_09110 [Micromonospora sp. NPDC052213]|uniref:hypothetical protein n=1 Tax=Micromonospora sp. NPDC052213 TaxID=3155812 RepID=UPI00342A8E08
MFNAHFPRTMFEHTPAFVDSYPANTMDNSAMEFLAGGVRWLVVSLKYNPTPEELAWADQVIAAHPRHQVMLNAHEYQAEVNRSAIGNRIWNDLARKHENVQWVFSGHYTSAGNRTDQGDNGNTVYGVQADYQTYSLPRVTENSYLRLMTFDTSAGTVE